MKLTKIAITLSLLSLPWLSQVGAKDAGAKSETMPNKTAKSVNQLGYHMLSQMSKTDNVVISPLSIFEALCLAREGAQGTTLSEMNTVMATKDDISADVKKLNDDLKTQGPASVDVANAIYIRKNFPVAKSYLASTKAYGEANMIDFNDAGKAQMNGFIENKTHNRIKNMIEKVSPLDALYLINAVYFKDKWVVPFKPEATSDDTFKGATKMRVKMMHHSASFEYDETSSCQIIKLPYRNSSLAMFIYLPKSSTPEALAKDLESGKLSFNPKPQTVNLSLPKFVIEDKQDLIVSLRELGIKQAFIEGAADFGKMIDKSSDKKLFISKALHKTFLQVDEDGTEAAAATVIAMTETSCRYDPAKPVEMIVDHPFLLTIADTKSGANLFVGAIRSPKAK